MGGGQESLTCLVQIQFNVYFLYGILPFFMMLEEKTAIFWKVLNPSKPNDSSWHSPHQSFQNRITSFFAEQQIGPSTFHIRTLEENTNAQHALKWILISIDYFSDNKCPLYICLEEGRRGEGGNTFDPILPLFFLRKSFRLSDDMYKKHDRVVQYITI